MARGLSVHIGINQVDAAHYGGWEGTLRACENDARDMQGLATTCGYQSSVLLTSQATSARVLKEMAVAAQNLQAGDVFFLTYAGHGAQLPDVSGGDEDDGQDETWVLYDRMLVDDELYAMWAKFRAGVRIVILSDSCHSGTVARQAAYAEMASTPLLRSYGEKEQPLFRAAPSDIAAATYGRHQSLYDGIQWSSIRGPAESIHASVLLLSGCQDNQTSADGLHNGLFTAHLKATWNNGQFSGTYRSFWKEIVRRMPPTQTPNYFAVGAAHPKFESDKPFAI